MKVVTAKQMQRIDKKASKNYLIPPIILMENAATASAFCVLQMLKVGRETVAIFCGQGNNGGDGFACARHLINHGVKTQIYFAGKENKLSNEAKINYQILKKQRQRILKPKLSSLKEDLRSINLIVDALLGIGISGSIREPMSGLIEIINNSQKPILSLDVPSGLDATTGNIHGIAIKAERTITFGLFKKGFLNPNAREYLGKVVVGDISLPRALLL